MKRKLHPYRKLHPDRKLRLDRKPRVEPARSEGKLRYHQEASPRQASQTLSHSEQAKKTRLHAAICSLDADNSPAWNQNLPARNKNSAVASVGWLERTRIAAFHVDKNQGPIFHVWRQHLAHCVDVNVMYITDLVGDVFSSRLDRRKNSVSFPLNYPIESPKAATCHQIFH